MSGLRGVSVDGIIHEPTFANDPTTPLVAADMGKPVEMNSATGLDIKLATAGATICGIAKEVYRKLDANGKPTHITCKTAGYATVSCNTDADAPVLGGWVVANGTGGVKNSATATNAYCVYVSAAVAKIKLLG